MPAFGYPVPVHVEYAQAVIQAAKIFEPAVLRLPATGIFVPRRTIANPELHTGTNEPSDYASSQGLVYDFRLTMPFMPRFIPLFLESLMGSVTPTNVDALATPTAPTVTPQGTVGATTYNYYVVAVHPSLGDSLPSPVGTTTTGNATLSAVNFNRVTFAAVTGATSYKVLKGTTGTQVGTTGTTTFDDVGQATAPYTPAGVQPAAKRRVYPTSLLVPKRRIAMELWDGNSAWKAWNVCVFSATFTGSRPNFVNCDFTGSAFNFDTLTSMTNLPLFDDVIDESFAATFRLGAFGTLFNNAPALDEYLHDWTYTMVNNGVYDWNENNNENPAALLHGRFGLTATYNGYEPSDRFQWAEFANKTRQVVQVECPGAPITTVNDGVKFNAAGFWNQREPNQLTQGRAIRLGLQPRTDPGNGTTASIDVINGQLQYVA
jgi:hypothetical protein